MQEELAVTHAREEIGCAQCHGDSDAHIADESCATGCTCGGWPSEQDIPASEMNARKQVTMRWSGKKTAAARLIAAGFTYTYSQFRSHS